MKLKRRAFLQRLKAPFVKRTHKSDVKEGRSEDTLGEKVGSSDKASKPVFRRTFSLGDDASTVVPTGGVTSPVSSPCATEFSYGHRGLDTLIDRTGQQNGCDTLSQTNVRRTGPESLPTHVATHEVHKIESTQSSANPQQREKSMGRKHVSEFFKALLTPASLTIIFSFPIALIPKLKALFVQVPGTSMPSAPDGLPPLNFLLDSASFVGAASVPLGLVCLGSSLARLSMPKKGEWKKLPMGAIAGIAAAKMVIMPVLGVLICTGLTNVGVISKDDKVLRFVCMCVNFNKSLGELADTLFSFISCLPTATVHVSAIT